MIDFHSHILPGMDSGLSPQEALLLLNASAQQGIDTVFATPRFNIKHESVTEFTGRRSESFSLLRAFYASHQEEYPGLPVFYPGAEVCYFPGISSCSSLSSLVLGKTGLLLVRPPVAPLADSLLDEIEAIGPGLGLVPVISQLDKICRLTDDRSVFERVSRRRILVQIDASFFLYPPTAELALFLLEKQMFQFWGSNCCSMDTRPQNIGAAAAVISEKNMGKHLELSDRLMYNVLMLDYS